MRLTVLGSSASYAGPGQACAGHLLECGSARVLLDCGNGVLANLARVCDPLTLDAVVVTHEHVDHFADVYALQALLRYAPGGAAPAVPLYAPAGLFDAMGCLLSDRGRAELAEAFVVHELSPGAPIELRDGLVLTPLPVDHTPATFAVRAQSSAGVLCYTSDTAAGERALLAARGCDLLLAEATLPELYAGRAPHMTAREAGELARQAGAGQLVLTHVWPTNDRDTMVREAAQVFGGPVSIATEFDTYEVGDGTVPARGATR